MTTEPDLISAYIACGGRIRHFEPGASGNPIVFLDWLHLQGVKAAYIGKGKVRIGRATLDLAGLYQRANEMRRAKGLEPFTIGPVHRRGHFCFNAAHRTANNRRGAP